jgi:ELWxxDGT repeat protein
MVEDVFPGAGGSEPAELVAFDGRLFFRACDPTSGCELWTSDGTAGGTALFKDILPGARSGAPAFLTVVGENLWFRACDDAAGCELWVSDGTSERTRRAADLRPGFLSSNPGGGSLFVQRPIVASDGRIYFAANGGDGEELWAIEPPLFDDGFESQDTDAWSDAAP